jgi:hypothetical protein
VSDGITTSSDTFVLTVNAFNDKPTISDITNKTTNEDTATAAIPFIVEDVDTDAASLTLSGRSSNSVLVPNENIIFSGGGANRTVTLTPVPNKSGTTFVYLTVSDGIATTTGAFMLTVNAVNDAPTITDITDKTTKEDTTTAAIALIVGDVDTAAASLTLSGTSDNPTLVPNANIIFAGSGAKRIVTLTPAANQTGTFSTSGSSLGTPSIVREISESQVLRESITMVELIDGLKYQVLTVTKSTGDLNLKRAVEVSPNLLDWYSGDKHTTVIQDDDFILKVRDNTPLMPGIKRFIRLKEARN